MRQPELHKLPSQEGESWYLAFMPGEVSILTQIHAIVEPFLVDGSNTSVN